MKQNRIVTLPCCSSGQRGRWREQEAREDMGQPSYAPRQGPEREMMFFKKLSWPLGTQLNVCLNGHATVFECALCSRFSNALLHFKSPTCSSHKHKLHGGTGVSLKVSAKVLQVIPVHLVRGTCEQESVCVCMLLDTSFAVCACDRAHFYETEVDKTE